MGFAHWLALGPMLGLLVVAAAIDLRTRLVPNWLTLCVLAGACINCLGPWRLCTPLEALAGLGVAFGLSFIMFAIGALGGGDVKLLAAVGAWVGPRGALLVFAGAAIVALVLALAQAAIQGRMLALLRNSWYTVLHLANAQHTGLDDVAQAAEQNAVLKRPLPYAIPVLASTVLVLSLWSIGGSRV